MSTETQDIITCVCGGTYSPQRYDVCPQCSLPLATLRERNAGAASAPTPGSRRTKSTQDIMFGWIRAVVMIAFIAGVIAFSINYENNQETGAVVKAACGDIIDGRFDTLSAERQALFLEDAKADAVTASYTDVNFALVARSLGDLSTAIASGDQALADQTRSQVLIDCGAIGVGETTAQ